MTLDAARRARRQDAVVEFAHAFVVAAWNRELHHRDSPLVDDALAELCAALRDARDAGVDQPLRLQCDEALLYHDGEPLPGPSLQARHLLQRCAACDIAQFGFDAHLQPDEANRLFDLLLGDGNAAAFDRRHRDRSLRAFGVRHVQVTLRTPGDPGDRRASITSASDVRHYQQLASALQHNHALALHDRELAVTETATAIERTVLDYDEPSLLLSLAMQDDVDRFTVGHSVRVALLALQVGRALGASRDQLVRLGSAALMHDIGKSKVPQQVLWKRGRLDDDEWRLMAQHPQLGAQILIEQHEAIDPHAIGAAFCHHMSPDGRGYPQAALPISPSGTSRLIRVCDVFEALTAVRPYKRALTPIEAYAVMFRNEQDFDPVWLRRFTRTLGLFPCGTRVQLDDGADGVVERQTVDVQHPVVRLLTGPDGATLPAGHPGLVVVGEPFEGRRPRIVGISTRDRFLTIPEFDPLDPAPLTTTVHGACLPGAHGCGDGCPSGD